MILVSGAVLVALIAGSVWWILKHQEEQKHGRLAIQKRRYDAIMKAQSESRERWQRRSR